MFDPGTRLKLHYPTHTEVSHIDRCTRQIRQLEVRRIRDLVREPLTLVEYCQRPYVFRSRYLVTAFDMQIREWRNFYVGSSDEYRSSGYLRLVWCNTVTGEIVQFLPGQYAPTPQDRRHLLRDAITISEAALDPRTELRILADDLRRIG